MGKSFEGRVKPVSVPDHTAIHTFRFWHSAVFDHLVELGRRYTDPVCCRLAAEATGGIVPFAMVGRALQSQPLDSSQTQWSRNFPAITRPLPRLTERPAARS